jgi:integrase
MPAYEKLPSGKHSYVARWPDGRRKRFTDQLKRVAKEQAEEFERSLRTGGVPHLQNRKLTVRVWHDRWVKARNVEPATAAKDASQLRTHVLPQWGDWPLQSIGRLDVQTWVKAMTHAGVGPSTVVGAYHRFAAMLSDAVLEGVLAASPCREIDLPKVVKPEPRWLSRHEYDRVQLALATRTMAVARTDRRVPDPQAPMWQAYVGLGCFSGLRPGEMAGLDVEHLDLDRNLVRVQQVMTRYGLRAYPKNSASQRWVPFPQEVAALLWRWVGDRASGPVFVSPEGARLDDRNFARRVWAPALKEAGVPACRVYVMRHTAASWLAQAGVSSDEIADILGHSSTRITSSVYRHMRPDQHDRVRAAWAEDVTHVGQEEMA